MNRSVKYTKEILEDAVRASSSMAGVLRILGLRPAGGTHSHISRRIRSFGLDTSHFTGKPDPGEYTPYNRHDWQTLLTERPDGSRRVPTHQLRRALLEYGISHTCALCGIEAMWNGMPLTLHVDHIDGNPNDSRPGNVRFLCPNCHSQTPTYAGRNLREGNAQN